MTPVTAQDMHQAYVEVTRQLEVERGEDAPVLFKRAAARWDDLTEEQQGIFADMARKLNSILMEQS